VGWEQTRARREAKKVREKKFKKELDSPTKTLLPYFI